MTTRKKLIEVALPLDAINREAAREKSIRHGHPSTLHLWWARRPLAACRAVLFASLVDDPSSHPDKFPTEEAQEVERQRLFRIIEEMVKWENTTNENVMGAARNEILKSTDGNPPPVLDPFCGGGSIPLEAQRLGLKAYASDLNPVAVLITKALIEIPPRFAAQPPVNPDARKSLAQGQTWRGATGLAEDVRYYGKWMRDEAERRIGHLYPKVILPGSAGVPPAKATVIAWLWARTVKCPNPACGAMMPLVRSFALSTKPGKKAWVEPVVDKKKKTVRFEVKTGNGVPPEGTVNRRGARCIACDESVPLDHVRAEGKAGRMSAQLMAIVAEGERSRIYLPPSDEQAAMAAKAKPEWTPDTDLPEQALGFRVQLYGMTKHRDLFTQRQLVALTTFSDLVSEARERVRKDAVAAGLDDGETSLDDGGNGATAYADAVSTYLAFAVDRATDAWSALASWTPPRDTLRSTFARHALSMVWDFAEANPFSESCGNWIDACLEWIQKAIATAPCGSGQAMQLDAAAALANISRPLISTDPPYYDNIGYADLSDFFYSWLRRGLGRIYASLFSTLLVPKAQELVATPFRFDGSKARAEEHFLNGLSQSFRLMRNCTHSDYPLSVYYAFKQSEEDENDANGNAVIASTGWETMLEGLIQAGFSVTGTWPMHTERGGRSRDIGSNALASSIILVCRPRAENAPMATRRELITALRRELADALKKLQHGNVAPVDFAQATIGPGMAVFSRYSKVLEADGSAMRVRTALQLINQELDAYFAEQEGELDADTRFCIAWFEQRGMDEGPFGEADVLGRAKNTAVEGLVRAGILEAQSGKVRLLRRDEYADDWDPAEDQRLTVWECTQHLIRALKKGGEEAAARLAGQLGGGRSEEARALAYRLYAICERKGWAQEALAYNTLVASWSDVQTKTSSLTTIGEQGTLGF
jgi:putative DNA methylase